MQIYEELKKDHDKVKSLLDQLIALDNDSPRKKTLVKKIRDELIPHSRAEESVFYNSLRAADTARSKVLEGFREHMEAETLLRTLQVMDKFDRGWKKVARQLKKALEHHIKEEEEEIFRAAKEVFSDEESQEMTAAFRRMKDEVRQEGIAGTTIDLIANLMPPRFSKSFRSGGQSARA